MLNHTTLMGRLTREPELKHTTSGIPVTSFTLAVDRPKSKDADSAATDFIDIVAWRGTAEFVTKWFRKGQLVAVEGRIQVRNYEDKAGNKRKAVEIVASQVHFAESKRDGGVTGQDMPSGFTPDFSELEDDDGALPF